VASGRRTWPAGSITDVAGVTVGHYSKRSSGWLSGTTVILLPEGTQGGVDVRGGAPGTRETELLHPTNMMNRVDAVCLSGGSAFGLSAAEGVVRHLESRKIGFPVGTDPSWVVPIVPAAVIFDLGRGGRFDRRPDSEFGLRAARSAKGESVAVGSVGAGTGARAGGLHGGVGMAAIRVGAINVAALAVVNSVGSVIDPSSALPWFTNGVDLTAPTDRDRRAIQRHLEQTRNATISSASNANATPLNTTIGMVITDADLDKAECQKLAEVAHDGLARAIRPAHSMNDGDTIFGLATRSCALGAAATADSPFLDRSTRVARFNLLLETAAETFARACTMAILRASGTPGLPAYRDLVPSAFRALPAD